MFSKLHHQHHHQNPHQQHHHHQNHPFSHHFQLSRESQTPDSDHDTTPPPKDLTAANHSPSLPSGGNSSRGCANSGDGASIEIVRRPRGRPPGSKNKPKPPVIVTHEPDPALRPYILEIPGGNDIVEAISHFSRRKNIGICVLTGSGTVSNVTLRQPSSGTPGATITFHGRFDILSLSATFISQTSCHVPNTVSISLACPQGQIVGGFVAGSLIAAGNVFIVAATFNNPSYHQLPGGEKEGRNPVSSGGAQSPPLSGGGDNSHGGGGGGADSCGVSMYNSHMGGSDVLWAPTARPPPPPPPY